MTKELSIENIKKELINKISNNSEILEVFRKREYSKDEGKCLREYGDSFIKDNYIFDHYVLDLADYISVEVAENEYPIYGNSKKEIRKSYNVSILVTLTDTSELDRISVLLGDLCYSSTRHTYKHHHNNDLQITNYHHNILHKFPHKFYKLDCPWQYYNHNIPALFQALQLF